MKQLSLLILCLFICSCSSKLDCSDYHKALKEYGLNGKGIRAVGDAYVIQDMPQEYYDSLVVRLHWLEAQQDSLRPYVFDALEANCEVPDTWEDPTKK